MTMGFDDAVFPSRLAFGIDSIAEMRVDITRLASGYEHRNTRWSRPRRRYVVAIGQRPMAEAQALLTFFEARSGPLRAFKFRDPMNNSTAHNGAGVTAMDVDLGVGNGVQTDFELRDQNDRLVTVPDVSTLRVAISGAENTNGFTVSPDGRLKFDMPPENGTTVTAGFEFFVAVRFENEELVATRSTSATASIADINLVEVHV